MSRTIDLRQKKEAESKPEPSYHIDPAQHQETQPQRLEKNKQAKIVRNFDTIDEPISLPRYPDVVRWSGTLHHHHPSKKAVIIISSFLLAAAAFSFFIQVNFIASFLFILLLGALLLHIRKDLEIVEFEADRIGIRIDNRLYKYRDLVSFWIEYEPDYDIKELSLHLKRNLATYVKIPLHDQSPVQLRTLMIDFIPEVEHHYTLADILARKLGI